jgi:hypothetical protein
MGNEGDEIGLECKERKQRADQSNSPRLLFYEQCRPCRPATRDRKLPRGFQRTPRDSCADTLAVARIARSSVACEDALADGSMRVGPARRPRSVPATQRQLPFRFLSSPWNSRERSERSRATVFVFCFHLYKPRSGRTIAESDQNHAPHWLPPPPRTPAPRFASPSLLA